MSHQIAIIASMPFPPRHIISKSTFVKGCQCEKALYLNRYHPQLKAEISEQQQAVFDRGTNLGLLAQQLFQGGIDASPETYFEYAQSVALTGELIANGQEIIYEAAFQYEGVLAAVDILVKMDGKWRAYEVKSTLDVKENHILDAALQYHVITQSGIPLEDIAIVHLNRDYARQGPLEIDKLFVAESILDEVLEEQEYISGQIPALKAVLEQAEVPAREIGPHCHTPYTCDFIAHCWKHIPSPSIFDIANLRHKRTFELYNSGIVRFEDITPETRLDPKQRIQVDSHLANKEHIDHKALKEFLAGLTYPMYFMDFETFAPAVPFYDGTRPYQKLPFQYSIHYKKAPDSDQRGESLAKLRGESLAKLRGESLAKLRGESLAKLRHTDFLAQPGSEPRREFTEQLLHMTRLPGTILTYNLSFERSVLRDLAGLYPEHAAAIHERITRLRDLMTPFRNYWYYSPKMKGSHSIKAVLPALAPDLSYDHLSIADGTAASNAFEHMTAHPEEDHTELIRQMKEYCKMDTMGMVRVLEVLESLFL